MIKMYIPNWDEFTPLTVESNLKKNTRKLHHISFMIPRPNRSSSMMVQVIKKKKKKKKKKKDLCPAWT